MNIEANGWDIINELDECILKQIEQIVIEFHNLEFLQNEYFGGFKDIPNTVECIYIRKDIITEIPQLEIVSCPISNLDYPNCSFMPDYILN